MCASGFICKQSSFFTIPAAAALSSKSDFTRILCSTNYFKANHCNYIYPIIKKKSAPAKNKAKPHPWKNVEPSLSVETNLKQKRSCWAKGATSVRGGFILQGVCIPPKCLQRGLCEKSSEIIGFLSRHAFINLSFLSQRAQNLTARVWQLHNTMKTRYEILQHTSHSLSFCGHAKTHRNTTSTWICKIYFLIPLLQIQNMKNTTRAQFTIYFSLAIGLLFNLWDKIMGAREFFSYFH